MPPAADRVYHVVRFNDPTEADAFVRALQRFLDGPRGEAFARNAKETQVWAPKPLTGFPVELYLTDAALLATEAGFAPVPAVEQMRGDELPAGSVLVMKGSELQEE